MGALGGGGAAWAVVEGRPRLAWHAASELVLASAAADGRRRVSANRPAVPLCAVHDLIRVRASAAQVAAADKRDYQQRLASERAAAQRAAARGGLARPPPVDHYKLLGLERSAAADDVRAWKGGRRAVCCLFFGGGA
jgi:hypothetical protein